MVQGRTEPGPTRGRGPESETYEEVIIAAEQLDWKKWSEFYDAVIQSLITAGAKINVKVEVQGKSEDGIPTNTVELSIKEALTQYGIPRKVEPKKQQQQV